MKELLTSIRPLLPLLSLLGLASLAGSEEVKGALLSPVSGQGTTDIECTTETSLLSTNEAPSRFAGCAGFLE